MAEDDTDNSSAIDADLGGEQPIPPDAIVLRNPNVPATVSDLAARGQEGVEIVKSRHLILQTLRAASIKMTYPEDWLLFRDRDQKVICYLQDSGCDRIAPLWGIEVFNISRPEKITGDNGEFVYSVMGDGRCAVTGGTVEQLEGMRASTDDIVKNATGPAKEYLVRKCARANLDGSILRELSGFKNVPLTELIAADSSKQWELRGAKGKGFGSGGQRQSQREDDGGEVDMSQPVPPCPKCGGEMWDNRRDKRNPRAPDFKCKKKGGKPECDGAKWQDKVAPAAATSAPATQTAAPAAGSAPSDEAPAQAAPPASGPQRAEEEMRLRRTIKSQFKGKKWDTAKQQELINEYLEACGKEPGGTLDQLGLDSLLEMHEELKKAS